MLTDIASEETWQPILQFKLAVLYGVIVSLSFRSAGALMASYDSQRVRF